MATNWIAPTAADLIKVIEDALRTVSDQNVPFDKEKDFDAAKDSRGSALIEFAILEVRSAIRSGGQEPLSVTEGCVPPEAVYHVLVKAAFELVNSTQTLRMVIMTEKGAFAPFSTFYKAANDYITSLAKGRNVTPASDPTGEDYVTAINVKWYGAGVSPYPAYNDTLPINRPIEPIRIGGSSYPSDLNTDQSYFYGGSRCWPYENLGCP